MGGAGGLTGIGGGAMGRGNLVREEDCIRRGVRYVLRCHPSLLSRAVQSSRINGEICRQNKSTDVILRYRKLHLHKRNRCLPRYDIDLLTV